LILKPRFVGVIFSRFSGFSKNEKTSLMGLSMICIVLNWNIFIILSLAFSARL
jgi:hypothetical protein